VHQRYQERIGAQRTSDLLGGNDAARRRSQIGDLEALGFEIRAGIENGLVFGDAGDDVTAAAAGRFCDTLDRKVVGFGRTGRPDDFTRIAIEQARNFDARFFDRLFGAPAEDVGSTGVVAA
jgi:hypothetical protein